MSEEPGGDGGAAAGGDEPILIRKYANRRLYNTATGAFVTLEDLRRFVADGQSFVVIDAKTGNEITSSVLAQIIADQEARGERVLPDALLRQIIGFYEQGLSEGFGAYLQKSIEAYRDNWEQMEKLGEMGRQNMEAFQRSLAAMFGANAGPAAGGAASPWQWPGAAAAGPSKRRSEAADAQADALARQVSELEAELRALRKKLDGLTGGKEGGNDA